MHPILTALLLLPILYALSVIYLEFRNPLRNIPGPTLANYTRFWLLKAVASRNWHKIITDLHRRYGPIVRIAPNEYSFDDPEAAKVIFRTRNQLEKAQWYHVFTAPGEPPGMFTMANNQQHLERRRQVNEFYTAAALNALAYRADHVNRIFFDKLGRRANCDGDIPLDICKLVNFYAYDALANLTFGQVFGCLENEQDINGLIEGNAGFLRYGMTVGVFVEWHPILIRILQVLLPNGNSGLLHLIHIGEQAIKNMKSSAENDMVDNEKTSNRPHSFVSLFQEKHFKNPSTFTAEDVSFHMIPNIVAGADTSSAALNTAIYFLSKNPRVLAKLRRELDEWAESQKGRTAESVISPTEAQALPYLQAVLKETNRILPGFGSDLKRVVPEGGLVLAGQFIPAGNVVSINPHVANANRDVFGLDAGEFRPERWLSHDENVAQMDQYFLTFGRGPRVCIGKNIALLLLNTLIPELVLRFDFEPIDPEKEWTVHDDTFMYQENFYVKVRERKRH